MADATQADVTEGIRSDDTMPESLAAKEDVNDSKVELERNTKKDEGAKTVPILKLFRFAEVLDIILIIVGTLGAIGTGAAQPIMTILFGQLINSFGQNATDREELVKEVTTVALRFVYLAAGTAVSAYFGVACWMVASERQTARMRSQYLRAILRQDVSYFDEGTSTGEVVTRMSGETVLVQEATGDKVAKFIQLFSSFAGGYIVAFSRSWKLTLVVMSVVPLLVIIGGTMAAFVSRASDKAQTAYAGAGTLVEQVISSIRTVASYTGEKEAVEDYDKNLTGAAKAGILQGLASGGGMGTLLGAMFATYPLALWYGAKLVLNGTLNGGQVINVIFAVLMGAMSMGQASPSLSAIAAGRAAAYNIFEAIDRTPPIDVYNSKGLIPTKLKGDVELREIDFRYPTRPDVPIFTKFSLVIPAGKTVALVGESGSGKSTVVNLIERFYDPESGQVLVDGVDIKTLQLKWLRQQIGLVSQEPVLFSTSIKENIAYGKEGATMEEIETAAALANAAKFIARIPQGYETLVGERGIQLSGGQKQRVAIARAILKNPRILLLDEATSALDAESERVVQEALDRVMADRTTVIVAHRLTTIRNADMIAVVRLGVIVETGTHDELIQNSNGAYSQLVSLQKVESPVAIAADPDYVPEPDEVAVVTRDSGIHSSRTFSFRTSLSNVVFGLSGSRRLSRDSSVRPSGRSEGKPQIAGVGSVDDKKEEEIRDVSILRLAKLNQPEAPLFVLGTLAAVGTGVTLPVFGLLLSSIVTVFFEPPHKLRKDINFWAEMFVVLAGGVFISFPIQSVTFAIIGQRLIRRLRKMTFEKILNQEISWFDEEGNSSGAVGARLSADAAAVRSLVGDALSLLVQNSSTIAAGFAIGFSASWQLAFVILAVVPLLGFQSYVQIKYMQGFAADVKVKYEDASRVANDAVSSVRTVASFVAEERVCNLYDEKCRDPVRNGIRQGLLAAFALAFANLVMFCSFGLCFFVGGKLVGNGTTTFRGVFRVFFAISLTATGVSQSAGMAPDLAKVKIAVNSIFALLDRKSKIDPSDMSGQTLKDPKGEIEFKHVSFFYPTRPDIQIFQDLSFQVRSGQTLALVGESGSGKSTVISLIERFYDPQSGVIAMDRVDIRKLQLKWLRQQIGLVSQEPVLLDENVDWNIVYGKEGPVSESEIEAAATAANAHRFISALPEGYKTRVGERGTQLSGGQKQRVAIARAILKDPKILLLDEATSALDAESEHVVQEALDRIMIDRTTIVVAHRLSTVRNANIIAVVKNGSIVEHGTHEELVAKSGAYASLVKLHVSS